MTDEQRNNDNTENSEEEPAIKSANVHMGVSVAETTSKAESVDVTAMNLPLRLLVVGDFTPTHPDLGNAQHPEDWADATPPTRVDKDNFLDIMAQLRPSLKFDVPNHLGGAAKELTVDLQFESLKAFRPEGIARQVDGLSKLLDLRNAASKLKRRELEGAEFEAQVAQLTPNPDWAAQILGLLKDTPQPPTTTPSTGGGSRVDSLLDMVDTGTTAAKTGTPSKQAVDSLVRAIVQPTGGAKRPSIDRVIEHIDATLSNQIHAVLHHPAFQQLEAVWRGLKFLTDRTDFRENVQIELLSAPKAHLRDAIYQLVFYPEYEDTSEVPLTAILAAYEFNASAVDVELLSDVARMATSMQVPFVSGVGTAFFDAETAEGLAKLPLLRSLFEQPKYTKWRAFREDETSQSVTLTTSRFLLRYPYGPEGEPVQAFDFKEQTKSSTDYLWGNGAFALGTTIVNSFVRTGWPVQVSGQRGGGVIDNLPLWSYRSGSRAVQIPIDVLYSQDREQEFSAAGLALISCRLNSDTAYVLSAPTAHQPPLRSLAPLGTSPEETREAALHATLPYQLFATRMAHLLRRVMKRDIAPGLTAESIEAVFTQHLQAFLKPADGQPLPGEAVQVEVNESEENSSAYEVILRIKPTFRILGRSVDLLLGFEIPIEQ